MVDFFLNNFSELKKGVNIQSQPFSKTLAPRDCSNGMPDSKYSNYGTSNFEVLYSSWVSYQSTLTAKFIEQQSNNHVPVITTNTRPGPANIFIIRHGEKNTGLTYHLNNNGAYRSCELVDYMNILATQGYPISYIITCNPCPFNATDPSMRPQQTIAAASFMLNIPTFIYGGSGDVTEVAEALYEDTFRGLNVLICWQHSAIQPLILAIANEGYAQGCIQTNADQFFLENNACPAGNYLVREQGSLYSPPSPSTNGDYTNSQRYPYWNNHNYDLVYWFNSTASNPYFTFNIFEQDCTTCYASCNTQICLFQPQPSGPCKPSPQYYNNTDEDIENNCQVPLDWQVPS